VTFEEFSEPKMCGNIKGKRENHLSQRWKKKVKTNQKVDLLLKNENDILYFPFWEACVLGF